MQSDPSKTRSESRGHQARLVADALRDDIISGRLAGGSVVRQQHLAERFGVSRIPVREALRRLAAEGLVDMAPNKGATVAPLSLADFCEIYEMRAASEVLALRTALPHLTDAQIDIAEGLQEQMEAAPVDQFGTLNAAFHQTLYEPCGRPRLLAHIAMLANAADRYLRVGAGSLGYAGRSHREHRALLAACRNRNAEAAMGILSRHIEEASAFMVQQLGGKTG